MDRRGSVRYDIRLACRLRKTGQPEGINGMTLNVGCSGALIAVTDGIANRFPQPGDAINIEILLPPNPVFGQRALACAGRAVRHQAESQGASVAIEFEHVSFKKAEPEPKMMASTAVM